MSTIVFSDSHLTAKFDPAKFVYLSKIVAPADRVIINGDFWDGYLTNFADLLASEWTRLFALLSQKETFYVCGNHDAAALNDSRTRRFAQWCGGSLDLTIDGRKYRFEHGHRITPMLDQLFPWLSRNKWLTVVTEATEHAGAWLFGPYSFIVNRPMNTAMKRWQRRNLPADRILVCGHSHWPEHNEPARYINTGYVRHHYAHHLEITGTERRLRHDRY